jgi:hypothetical protein
VDPGGARGGAGRRQRRTVHPRRDDRPDRLHDGPQRGDVEFDEAISRASGPAERDDDPPLDGAARRTALLDAAAVAEEQGRLDALHATGLLDSDISPSFDRLARLASRVLHAPVALVSLVDADRQFFKSCLGLPEPWASRRGSPLTHSFCQHAVAAREPLVVNDAREHEVLRENLAIRDMRRRRLRRHTPHRQRWSRPRNPLRHRQSAAPLDHRADSAPQRHRRVRGH